VRFLKVRFLKVRFLKVRFLKVRFLKVRDAVGTPRKKNPGGCRGCKKRKVMQALICLRQLNLS
jgi:hypothetical protein